MHNLSCKRLVGNVKLEKGGVSKRAPLIKVDHLSLESIQTDDGPPSGGKALVHLPDDETAQTKEIPFSPESSGTRLPGVHCQASLSPVSGKTAGLRFPVTLRNYLCTFLELPHLRSVDPGRSL